MAFVSARCPNCRGEIQLDDSKKSGFCLHCGSKILVEEAVKKVKIDRTDSIDKYLKLARNASKSNNHAETEKYCNMILEIENDNIEYWYLKGKAVGWQTSLSNNRLTEMITSFISGLECLGPNDDEVLKEYSDLMCCDILAICQAIIELVCNNFSNYPSDSNVIEYSNQISNIISCLYPFAILVSKNVNVDFDTDILNDYAALKGNIAAVEVWNKTLNEFGTNKEEQTKYAWERYIETGDVCLKLLSCALLLSKEEITAKAIVDNYVNINISLIGSCSWTKHFTDYGSFYVPDYSLTESAKNLRYQNNHNMNMQYSQKVTEIKKEKEKKKRQYYIKHPDVLQKEINEKKEIIKSTTEIINQYNEKIIEIDNKIATLNQQLKNAGLFSFSEKNRINKELTDEKNQQNAIVNQNNKVYSQYLEAKAFIEKYEDILNNNTTQQAQTSAETKPSKQTQNNKKSTKKTTKTSNNKKE